MNIADIISYLDNNSLWDTFDTARQEFLANKPEIAATNVESAFLLECLNLTPNKIGRAHVWTPVTL